MHAAIANARGTDAKNIKDIAPALRDWTSSLPAKKEDRGFRHTEVAKLLCPASEDDDIADPAVALEYHHKLRALDPEEWPPFMYYKDVIHDNNPWRGFLKADYVVNVGRVLFCGKASLGGRRPSGNSLAVKYQMRTMTTGALTYIATIAYFAISADINFSPTGSSGEFQYMAFYNHLLTALEDEDETRRTNLLGWWTDKLFSQVHIRVARREGVIPSTERLRLVRPRDDDDLLDY
ncbi:hypothetical protein EXIGLDRAFT_778213 [Exidia glandulosa HHB12029]|uniref:Uncharacterized protein n=1 Tax=Exidia glandulosa HHB12029 TaxID=1314781 RepID=A0A165CNG1_EXIGL|nr:hypothetical protein EXIGLDRAFT_778213 [Exidia glandulosa HHB12029]